MPNIITGVGPVNTRAVPGEPGYVPPEASEMAPETVPEPAPEPPGPTPGPGPAQGSTPPPSSPASSDPEPAAVKPAPKRADRDG